MLDNILDFLDKEKPDILALQEVYNGKDKDLPLNYRSIEVLQDNLSGFHYYFSPELRDNLPIGKIDMGNAVFSRFPIIKKKTIFFDIPYDSNYVKAKKKRDYSRDPKNMQYVQVEADGKVLNIFNLHGIWGFDGKDNPHRLAMGEKIIEQSKSKDNVILAGDFNLRPNTKTIGNVEKYLRNVFKDELTTTFNMKHKDRPGYATSVVDMIFVSKNIKVFEHYCPQIDISDHLPLVCNLGIE